MASQGAGNGLAMGRPVWPWPGEWSWAGHVMYWAGMDMGCAGLAMDWTGLTMGWPWTGHDLDSAVHGLAMRFALCAELSWPFLGWPRFGLAVGWSSHGLG